MSRILVIDDEPGICQALEKFFRAEGHEVRTASRAETGLTLAEAFRPDTAILDVRLPGMNGLAALERLRKLDPDIPAIVVTAYGTVETAIEAVRRGAYDYLVKPLDLDRISEVVNRALASRKIASKVAVAAGQGGLPTIPLIGRTPAMQEVYKRIGAVSLSSAAVLVVGESGTGKELVARAIHYASSRAARPFVTVSCGAVPEEVVLAELFGAEGSPARVGRVEAAEQGTLFLDDVATLPPPAQVALLGLLEGKEVEKVGGTARTPADVRLISATSTDLRGAIATGRFREDLFYRLNVVTIHVPPLRERLPDLPLLAAHFLRDTGAAISMDALRVMMLHTWPGNVRELRSAVEHSVVLSRAGTILPEHLPENVVSGSSRRPEEDDDAVRRIIERLLDGGMDEGRAYEAVLARFEAPLLREVLRRVGGSQVKASRLLGIHRTTLRGKIQRYGL